MEVEDEKKKDVELRKDSHTFLCLSNVRCDRDHFSILKINGGECPDYNFQGVTKIYQMLH